MEWTIPRSRDLAIAFHFLQGKTLVQFIISAFSKNATIRLKMLVDREHNRVVFAESQKDFVDILLSFFTLPIGTIIRLLRKQPQPLRMGCLNSLYEGLENLEAAYFKNDICKNMLLRPRNPYADECRKLKLNIDDTEPTKYYLCKNYQSDISRGKHLHSGGDSLSIFGNMRCKCRQPMDHEVCLEDNGVEKEDNGDEGVFVAGTSTFIITDDLQIMPMSTAASLALMKNLNVMDMKALEEMNFDVTLEQKLYHPDLVCFQRRYPIQTSRLEDISIVDKKIAFKITVRKSIQKVLFAEAEEDFINFLFSLLTFPLGSVLNFSGPTSLWGSISNLWSSVEDCNYRYTLRKNDGFLYSVYIGTLTTTNTTTNHYSSNRISKFISVLNSKSSTSPMGGGYMTGPSTFMVTDDLVVTPLSPISVFSFLESQNVPVDDLEQRMVSMGIEEALRLLEACFISQSALTKVFVSQKGSKQQK
ncbi:hypothetical protein GIB67_007610 [Kingdonia uniflora]|uniref:DUF674 family protein n=1 Tax=Kingdonia uniflora TaxID=39325 RepID=A0A7J7N1A1_9MAGN|nr:hypothetical protein GIB67_007610 [Kingdonia uniflora]